MEPFDDPNVETALARTTDPDTSHAAAQSVDVQAMQALIRSALASRRERGGTSEEISDWLGLRPWSVSPRLKPMEAKGLIHRSGHRVNRSGRMAIVWVVND